jgi:MOSC domain-containing protein
MHARVAEIGRYPIKSMLGERPEHVVATGRGIEGDRSHALIDVATGKVASAKLPRLWSGLLGLTAAYVDRPQPGAPILVRAGNGEGINTTDTDFDDRLSELIGRDVRLAGVPAPDAGYEDEWPDLEGLAPAELIERTRTSTSLDGRPVSTLPVGLMAPGTFQDVAPITILTTASLRCAQRLAPASCWDARRFRANLLVDVDGDDFVENEWVGRQFRVGNAVLEVIAPTPRCVMTTLAQTDLPADRDILRTVARSNRLDVAGTGMYACFGVYASVVVEGNIHCGDTIEEVRD